MSIFIQGILCQVESLEEKPGGLTQLNLIGTLPHLLPTQEAKALLGKADYQLHQLFYGGILYEAVK